MRFTEFVYRLTHAELEEQRDFFRGEVVRRSDFVREAAEEQVVLLEAELQRRREQQ